MISGADSVSGIGSAEVEVGVERPVSTVHPPITTKATIATDKSRQWYEALVMLTRPNNA